MLVFLLAACTTTDSTGNNDIAATSDILPTATPVPNPLTICLGEAPNTLYPYGNPNRAARLVLQAKL
jgi:hypothetical protein